MSSTTLPNEKIIIFTLGITMLMEFIDVSALNTSLPQIAYALHTHPINLKVVLTVYLLALGAFIPAAGWFSERFGIKRVLLVAIVGFLLSSIGCGLANSLFMLTIARALQGSFGAFIAPVARLTVIQLFRERLAEVMNKIVSISLMGPLLGPLIGGAMTTLLNWRFIFFINIPVGVFALVTIASRFSIAQDSVDKHFDLIGFLLLAGALASMLFTINVLTLESIHTPLKIMTLVVSLSLFFIYYRHTHRVAYPIIHLAVFKNTTYSFFISIMTIVRLFAMSIGFLGPLYMQTQYHYTAWEAGLMVAPIVLGAFVSKQVLSYLMARLSIRQLVAWLLGIQVIVEWLLAYSMLHFTLPFYILLSFINGFNIGLLIPILMQTSYSRLNKAMARVGSIINSAVIQLSQAFSIALIALILIVSSKSYTLDWHALIPKSSYAMVLWISSAFLALAMIALHWMPKSD